MAKVSGPLLSFSASGQIANAQVYASWRGIQYVRQKVIPANPRTSGQLLTRNTFSWLSNAWKFAVAELQAPWAAATVGQKLTARNLWAKRNIPLLRSQVLNTDMVMSPGANGGLSAAAATATGGSGTITGAMTAPTLPSGWTVASAVMVAMKSLDPQNATTWNSYVATDVVTPFAPVISGLSAGIYVVGLWFTYQKPDGTIAYGPSTMTTATVT